MSRMGPNHVPVPGRHPPPTGEGRGDSGLGFGHDRKRGRAPGHGENSPELHRNVAENIDHLVHLGLAEYTGDTPRTARLTQAGQDAAASMP